jgi:hypothetical protein
VIRASIRFALTLAILLSAPPAFAQEEDDRALKPAEPDFTLVNLPTSLRLPAGGGAFRVTHRFTRPLKCDTCATSLIGSGFGIDDGAVIGLEFRFGIFPGGQVIAHRSRVQRAVQFMGEFGLTRQREGGSPFEMAALVAIEGTQNFQEDFAPSVGVALTRMFGDRAAIHIDPMFVANANLAPSGTDSEHTFALGLGGRLALTSSLYVVGEYTPRLSGYKPGTSVGSFAVEKRIGGHAFQINVANDFGTTLRQIVEGADDSNRWYLGFNISRKFF